MSKNICSEIDKRFQWLRPFIANDKTGAREMVENGKTGFCTSLDSSLMAQSILQLLENEC